eukprot:GILK01013851.1.p1 GENE.GILK01013851.1~~GILK01013851.1.p1  ORF type:complete len:141 (-),score=4.57 GILK01013851.1:475-858(-)
MAIFGIGVDIVKVSRVADVFTRYGERFLRKYLHPEEIVRFKAYKQHDDGYNFLASRWAAKESAQKAVSSSRLLYPEIVIRRGDRGQPLLVFEGAVGETIKRLKISKAHVALSHDTDYAMAQVILERL